MRIADTPIRLNQAKRSVYEKITSYQVLSSRRESRAVELIADRESFELSYQEVSVAGSRAEVDEPRCLGGGLKRARKHQRAFIGRLKRAWIAFERQRLVAISQFYVK